MNRWLIALTSVITIMFFQNCGHNSSFEVATSISSLNVGNLDDLKTGFQARWAASISKRGANMILNLANLTDFSKASSKELNLGSRHKDAQDVSLQLLPPGDYNLDGYEDLLVAAKYLSIGNDKAKYILEILSGNDGSLLKSQTVSVLAGESLESLQLARSFKAADGESYIAVVAINSGTNIRHFSIFTAQLDPSLEIYKNSAAQLLRDINDDLIPDFIQLSKDQNGTRVNLISGSNSATLDSFPGTFTNIYFSPDSNADSLGELILENRQSSKQTFAAYSLAEIKTGGKAIPLSSNDFTTYMPPNRMSLYGHLKSSVDWESVSSGCPLAGGECTSFQHINYNSSAISSSSNSLYLDFSSTHPANKGLDTKFPVLQVADSDNNGLDELILVYQLPSTLKNVVRVYNPRTDKLIGEQEFGDSTVSSFGLLTVSQWR